MTESGRGVASVRRARRARRGRLAWLGAGLLVLVLVAAGGVGLYLHLNGNLRTMPLTSGGAATSADAGPAPINVLVIGSDTRASRADCAIGGACSLASATSGRATSAAANADVVMVVHISADRTNATILSIPRDTMVTVPSCTDPAGAASTPHAARITSTLQYGADCTTSAVHRLTGIVINHFLVIDFAGAVQLSDAVGGVSVCVDRDVYDPYSRLKLSAGTHTLKGVAALEFLRTRHGFGDGSDVGRTIAQHIFLSSMLRTMESASTLANPVKVLKLANVLTSVATVDTGLGTVKALTSLAYQLGQVPGSRITFVTMPSNPDPSDADVVVPAPGARTLFAGIAADTSLTGPVTASGTSNTAAARSRTRVSASDDATTVTSAIGCAKVSTDRTVTVNGLAMTPTQAYQLSSATPDSAS